MQVIQYDKSDEYFANDALSQSKVKALLSGLGSYKAVDPDREEPEHFILGNAVDCKLLTPSLFDRDFHVSQLEDKPSDKVMSIIRMAFDNRTSANLENNHQELYDACNAKEYYLNRRKTDINDDGRILDIMKKGVRYWDELIASDGKTILDRSELEIVNTIVDGFRSHDHTRYMFMDDEFKICFNQLPIYFTYRGVKCKALLDSLIIDVKQKTIQIVDVKTMGEVTKLFPYNARRRRYDIQAAWYTLAVSLMRTIQYSPISSIKLDGFRILPFKFIVDSTFNPGFCPLVYTCTPTDLDMGRYGARKKSIAYKVNNNNSPQQVPISHIYGFEQGIDRYLWHEENGWNYDKHILESNGNLPLKIWDL